MDTVIVAIGPMCWGKGSTVTEAVKRCKANAPRSMLAVGKHPIRVYRIVNFLAVNGLGGISYGKGGSGELIDEQSITIRK